MDQVTHIQYFGRRALDSLGDVARVEIHQAHTGIFNLCAADPIRCVINVVW
ncbi:hypothetical protein D3C80_1905610 [compost metagenome]